MLAPCRRSPSSPTRPAGASSTGCELDEHSVGALVDSLAVSQPTVSKHLKVLRDAGFVTSRVAAQQRIYELSPAPFEELDEWLEPYRRRWTRHLDALERHLDRQEDR